jgi:hypothetical protein
MQLHPYGINVTGGDCSMHEDERRKERIDLLKNL